MKTIQIFVTGGTFDKTYDYINGKLFFKETHLPEMLNRSRSRLNIQVNTLMMVDSLEMTETQSAEILKACQDCTADQIVITHGTDRMTETASILAQAAIQYKTIVLTGAIIPYAFGSSSDGFFNLGCALSFVQTLKEGVYISMHGQYFDWDKVRKNTSNGIFESL